MLTFTEGGKHRKEKKRGKEKAKTNLFYSACVGKQGKICSS